MLDDAFIEIGDQTVLSSLEISIKLANEWIKSNNNL